MDRRDMRYWYVDVVFNRVEYTRGSMECFEVAPYKVAQLFNGFTLLAVL